MPGVGIGIPKRWHWLVKALLSKPHSGARYAGKAAARSRSQECQKFNGIVVPGLQSVNWQPDVAPRRTAGFPTDARQLVKKKTRLDHQLPGAIMIITVDGLAGSGKGTIARMFAAAYGFCHLDCGLIYRAGAKLLNEYNCQNLNEEVSYFWDPIKGISQVLVRGIDLQQELVAPHYAELASRYAADASTAPQLAETVRILAKAWPKVIADGRNTGSTIFPQAEHKFFLSASEEIRAQRRFLQLSKQNLGAGYLEVLTQLKTRDARDQSRSHSPLTIPAGAHLLETDKLNAEKCCAAIAKIVFGEKA